MAMWKPPRLRTQGYRELALRGLSPAEQSRVVYEFIERHGAALRRAFPDVTSLSVGKRLQGRKVRTHSGLVLVLGVDRKVAAPTEPLPDRVLHVASVRERRAGTRQPERSLVAIPTDIVARACGQLLNEAGAVFSEPQSPMRKHVLGCLAARVTLGNSVAWLTAGHVAHAIGRTHRLRTRCRIGPRPWTRNGPILGRVPRNGWCWPRRDADAPFRTDAALVPEEDPVQASPQWIAGKFRRHLPQRELETKVLFYMMAQGGRRRRLRFAQMHADDQHEFTLWPGRSERFPRFAHFSGPVKGGDSGAPVFRIASAERVFVGLVFGSIDIEGVSGPAVWTFDDLRRAFETEFAEPFALAPM